MDKKDIIRGVLLALVLVVAWVGLKFYWHHTHPEWFLPAAEPSAPSASTQPTTAASTQYASTQPSGTQPSDVASATTTTTATTGPATGPSVAAGGGPSVQAGFTV